MAELEVSVEGGVATLTMNRPEARNALSIEMRTELDRALHAIENDPAVRCVVLTGAGEHFMSGGDVKGMHELINGEQKDDLGPYFLHRIHNLHTIMFAMRRMPKPIVAKVRGAVAGAGVSIAAACDLIMAEEDAFFTLAYCHIGTTPDGSGSFHLPRAIGVKKAMEMMLLGDRHSARQMADMGLVNFVVPGDELDAACAKLAGRLAKGPTFAYGQGKRLMYRSLENEFESQLQMEAEMFASCVVRKDFREGVTAFVEKRKANFTGD